MLKNKAYKKFLDSSRFQYILILFSSIFLSIISEYIFRGDLLKTFIWLFSNPISFFLNLFIVFSIILLFTSIFNNYSIGASIVSVLIIVFSLVNRVKFRLRGIPLIPEDFQLNNEMFTIAGVVMNRNTNKLIILSSIGILLIIFLIMRLPKFKLRARDRFILSIISIVVLFSFINTDIFKNVFFNNENINCQENGFVLFFLSSINSEPINLTFEYTEDSVKGLRDSIKELKDDKTNKSITDSVRPNIIVVMNEAFWDPSVMKGIQFNKSPAKSIDELRSTSIYGYLESPVFGGGTANAEFELLTGNSVHFFNPGHMVYSNEIKDPIIALPSILKGQGYTCKAIHPFKSWYWDRSKVYKYMGFDEYLSEEYFIAPEDKGFFISDECVTDVIIKEIEESKEPIFIFAVTMQNHGPFNDNRYGDIAEDIEVSGQVSDESLKMLRTYTQGIYDADKALGKLTDYCSSISKPTVVLFFGDHLPILGEDYKVYKEAGYISESNADYRDKMKLSSVPFVLWSNYKTKSLDLGLLNMSFMGPYLLEYAQLDMPNYFKFLKYLSKQISVISRDYAIDKEGQVIDSRAEEYITHNNEYMLAQYDILYREKALEDNYTNWIVEENSNYNSALNKISIEEVIIQEDTIIIKGNNFYPSCLLFIDKKSHDYKYINNNEIHIKKDLLKSGSKVQIKLFDSIKNLLAESNTYVY